jgi:hypothetical protein
MFECGGYGFTSSIGYPRSDLVGLLVNDGMRTISEAPVLYYRFLRTSQTLSGKGSYPG